MTMNEPSSGSLHTEARDGVQHQVLSSATPLFVCPYCGASTPDQPRCISCRGFLDPLSRQASQNAMGPWFLRNPDSPHQSGCSYETLVMLVSRGRVTVDSVLRGPTTHQFWTPAKRVPGVASLLGLCHNCGCDVDGDEHECPECHAEFVHHPDRQDLGLMPVRAVPGQPVPVAAESPREPATREAPARLAEPSAALLRHVEALESQNRWVWKLAIAMLALVSVTAALAAAGLLSGFLRVDPSMAGSVQTPAPDNTSESVPPPAVSQPGPSGAPARPIDDVQAPGGASPEAPAASEPDPPLEPKGNLGARGKASESLDELTKLVARDTDESLNEAVRRLEAMGAGDGRRPEFDQLLRTAKARQGQRALRGVR